MNARADEPLLGLLGRRLGRRLRTARFGVVFRRLVVAQSAGAAGDALMALALAGSLFFSVPETTARGRVALYLFLTVAPFAIVAPLLAGALNRHAAALRAGIVVSLAIRAGLTWMLATRLDSLLLFPIAFGMLVAGRAYLVMKGAMTPAVLRPRVSLVAANAALARVSAVSALVAGCIGIAIARWGSAGATLQVAAAVYAAGAVAAVRLPAGRAERRGTSSAPAWAPSRALRRAAFAIGSLRFLTGFLVFHLAFALRRERPGSIGLGVLIAAAASGTLLAAVAAPRLRRRLHEHGILTAMLVAAAIGGMVAGKWFSLAAAAVLVLVYGTATGAGKLAFDALVQADVPAAARGAAFARFEAVLQLAWVVGAAIPLAVPIPAGTGVVATGIAATAAALAYAVGRGRGKEPRRAYR